MFDRQHFPAADPVVRTESEPGGKRGRTGEAREVRTDLRQKSLRGEDVDPWDACQVHPEDSIEVILQVETGFASTRFLPVWRFREGPFRGIRFRFESLQKLRNFAVTCLDQLLVMTKCGQRLVEREQMLAPIVAHQRLGDGIRSGLDPSVAQCRQRMRVALPRQDGLYDRHSGHTGDIADHVVQLQVHLIQSFLHVLDVTRSHLHQAVPMPKDRTHRADRLFRPERSAQQTYRMQILQPLTVGNIRFASGHILHVTCVDQQDGETLRLQDLKKRDPVDACRFHRHRLNLTAFQPVRSGVQVARERREMPYRLWIMIHRHGDVNLRRSYIHTGSIRVQAIWG